jgi:hypothetical protein
MHEWGDSGITAVLLAIGVAVLLSLYLSQQARKRAERYKDARRLQSLAAEEPRREEEQANAEYKSMLATSVCTVCLNPSTKKCSRCKAVRYWYISLSSFSHLISFLECESCFSALMIQFSFGTLERPLGLKLSCRATSIWIVIIGREELGLG